MDNPPAGRPIGRHRRLEKQSEVFRPFWTNTKMPTVRDLVRFAPSDKDAFRALRFQQCRQRFSYAAAVGKDKPALSIGSRGMLRGYWFISAWFELPLKLI